MTWQSSFRVIIRVIFIFAYIAFLAASIRHIATFFHNFESDQADWVNPYTLAVSIDLTSLVLTVGVMFFRKNMPWYAQVFTWIFIIALTGFSWFVNWEYAMTYQGNDLQANDTLRMINPILASSFAFLNLAYSVVAEFFSSKTETASELAAKVDELEQLEEHQRRMAAYKERTKQPSVIQRVKNTAKEAKEAVNEVLSGGDPATPDPLPVEPVVSQSAAQSVTPASTQSSTQPVTTSVIPAATFVTLDSPEVDENSDTLSDIEDDIYGVTLSDAEVEGESDVLSDTGEHEKVEVPVSPKSRITIDLSDIPSSTSSVTERNTDKLNKLSKLTDLEKRIRRFIARNPGLNDTQIATKASCSRSNVAKVRAKMQKEVAA